MFDVGASLRPGFDEARRSLAQAQAIVASSDAGGNSLRGGAMAKTAQAALFEEALLSAEHARLAEIKSVAR